MLRRLFRLRQGAFSSPTRQQRGAQPGHCGVGRDCDRVGAGERRRRECAVALSNSSHCRRPRSSDEERADVRRQRGPGRVGERHVRIGGREGDKDGADRCCAAGRACNGRRQLRCAGRRGRRRNARPCHVCRAAIRAAGKGEDGAPGDAGERYILTPAISEYRGPLRGRAFHPGTRERREQFIYRAHRVVAIADLELDNTRDGAETTWKGRRARSQCDSSFELLRTKGKGCMVPTPQCSKRGTHHSKGRCL